MQPPTQRYRIDVDQRYNGRRLLSNHAFRKGELVLEEYPVAAAPPSQLKLPAGAAGVWALVHAVLSDVNVRKLFLEETTYTELLVRQPPTSLDAIDSSVAAQIANSFQLPVSDVTRIYSSLVAYNWSYRHGDGKNMERGLAFYRDISFVNHDCNANCAFSEVRSGAHKRVVALRDISVDEEITINYIGNTTNVDGRSRRAFLKQEFNFRCGCNLCKHELCATCGSEGLQRCAGCKLVCYCGKSCQKKHWAEHRNECKMKSPNKVPI